MIFLISLILLAGVMVSLSNHGGQANHTILRQAQDDSPLFTVAP